MNDDKIDELLDQIDEEARECGVHEFGLPLFDKYHREYFRTIIRKWAKDVEFYHPMDHR